jgi:mRNA-degrading endonuclease RelE of RelBE toxin-antitoxin system
MRYEITLLPGAVEDLRNLKANVRAAVYDAVEQHMRHEPAKISRSPILRFRRVSRPQYRLRAEDVRIYYDVAGERVEILAIVSKAEADAWLRQQGEIDETDSTL